MNILSCLFILFSISNINAFGSDIILGNKDDRVPSDDKRVGRLLSYGSTIPNASTAWLTSTGWVLTGAHCLELGDGWVPKAMVEFNVPLSTSNGSINPSAKEDQYWVDVKSIKGGTNSSGNDWAMFRLLPNIITGKTAFQTQGSFFRLTDSFEPFKIPFMVTNVGFGLDGPPPAYGVNGKRNEYNFTQQTDSGEITSVSGCISVYDLDTLGGSSGSPVYLKSTNYAYSIHRGRLEDSSGNEGTTFQNETLSENLSSSIIGSYPVYYVDSISFPAPNGQLSFDGTPFRPYRFLQDALCFNVKEYRTLAIVSGKYPVIAGDFGKIENGLITIPTGVGIQLVAVAGPVSFYATTAPSPGTSVSKAISMRPKQADKVLASLEKRELILKKSAHKSSSMCLLQ